MFWISLRTWGQALEKKLRDVGEGDGVAVGDAVFRNQIEQFAEDVIDVAGGFEIAGERNEAAGGLIGPQEFVFAAGVEDAESGVLFRAGHAAGASVGKRELAQIGPRCSAGRGRCGLRVGFRVACGGAMFVCHGFYN